jgi:hypothetical protein
MQRDIGGGGSLLGGWPDANIRIGCGDELWRVRGGRWWGRFGGRTIGTGDRGSGHRGRIC